MRVLFERYLLVRELELSPPSLAAERRSLGHFEAFCRHHQLAVRDLDQETLAAYRRELCPGRSARRNRALATARRFCVWAHRAGHMLVDLSGFPIPGHREVLPRVPSTQQMLRLLQVPDPDSVLGPRNRLVLELLYVLGLRAGECHRLDLDQLDLAEQTLRVRGKGGHERLLPVSPGLSRTCLRYLERSRPRLARNGGLEPALLVSQRGRRLSLPSLAVLVRQAGQAIGLKLHPHLLRHAFATHLAEGGLGTRQIQVLLGHVRLSSTTRYTRISPQELRREFFRCHPRARLQALFQTEEDTHEQHRDPHRDTDPGLP